MNDQSRITSFVTIIGSNYEADGVRFSMRPSANRYRALVVACE